MSTIGPAWTQPGTGGRRAGRFPLAVERHMLQHVARLLPGVTTVTPHGRYYALHGLVAAAAQDQSLSDLDARTLLRRAEVALAAVSVAHEDSPSHEGLGRAHGADAIAPAVHAGSVDVTAAATTDETPARYAKSQTGFLGPYRGSEILLGIVDNDTLRPGPSFDPDAVTPALGDILTLASQDHLDSATLEAHSHLCICAGAHATDGLWLAGLLAPTQVSSPLSRAATRRDTIRLVTRLIELGFVASVTRDAGPLLMYGATAHEDPVLRQLSVTQAWTGTALRGESTTQWRELWSWLVKNISSITTRDSLAAVLSDALPEMTVGQFLDTLPPLRDDGGYLFPAETDPTITTLDVPGRALAVIALSGQRARDLDGETLIAFQGKSGQEAGQQLAPRWVANQLDGWADRSLRDFGRHLTHTLLDRSQRIAFAKASRDKTTGLLTIPSRVHLRDEWVFKDSNEGAGPVSLRWDQLVTVLAEAGVTERRNGRWFITDRGHDVLT